MRKLIVIALVMGCLGVLASVAMAATKSIKVGDDYYVRPSGVPMVTVSKGTTVKWNFRGSNPHTVTVSKGPRKFELRRANRRLVQEEAHQARHLHDLLHRSTAAANQKMKLVVK